MILFDEYSTIGLRFVFEESCIWLLPYSFSGFDSLKELEFVVGLLCIFGDHPTKLGSLLLNSSSTNCTPSEEDVTPANSICQEHTASIACDYFLHYI